MTTGTLGCQLATAVAAPVLRLIDHGPWWPAASPSPVTQRDRAPGSDRLNPPPQSTAFSQTKPSGSVKGPLSVPMEIPCEPLPSGATPASLARARRP
jgi:hypothetical protein